MDDDVIMFDEDLTMQDLRQQCNSFASQVQQAETAYIRLGLQFHCLKPSSDWPVSHAEEAQSHFIANVNEMHGISDNAMMMSLVNFHLQLGLSKQDFEAGRYVKLQKRLDEANYCLTHFKNRLEKVKGLVEELALLSGLQDLAIDANKAEVDAHGSKQISFHSNMVLWAWVMELPLVKGWLKNNEVATEEHAFVRVVKLGDSNVKMALLWISE